MKQADKLHAYWSKRESDLIVWHPAGEQTKCDAKWLCWVLGREFQQELTRRGYDLTTLRFSIAPRRGHERFDSQRQHPLTESA